MSGRVLAVTFLLVLAAGIALVRLQHRGSGTTAPPSAKGAGCAQVSKAFSDHESSSWLTLSGHITRLLSDSHGRYEHQRFILTCSAGQTVLIVNDVSIGQRVPVHVGDSVAVRGQYIWNNQGGLVHFTHHNLDGGQGGWILYGGRTYALTPSSTFPGAI